MVRQAMYMRLAIGFVLICGCSDSEGGSQSENTAAVCADDMDNDGDGAVDCDDAECLGTAACTSSDDNTGDSGGDVSGMPVPPVDDVPRPSGAPENLTILDWAGFKAATSYTFDDSQPSHIEHYDALQATGVSMTFFASNGVGGGSSYDESFAQMVEDGHEIGNHTAHHCYADLTRCGFGDPAETTDAEIEECGDYITEHFGQDGVWTLAAPFGDSGWNSIAEAHVFLNRTVSRGTVGANDGTNPFALPSVALVGGETASDLNADLDAVYADGEWLIFCIHSILPTGNDWYAGVDIESLTGSIEHVIGLGDMWIDTMANVGAYWLGQRILSEATPVESGDDTVWTWALPEHFPRGKFLRVTVDGGTLKQNDEVLPWSPHGYFEVSLDAGSLTLSP